LILDKIDSKNKIKNRFYREDLKKDQNNVLYKDLSIVS